ncbi:hypothetical protein CHUAL_010683 [Chamberlinius hualienensis]
MDFFIVSFRQSDLIRCECNEALSLKGDSHFHSQNDEKKISNENEREMKVEQVKQQIEYLEQQLERKKNDLIRIQQPRLQ